MTQDTTPPKKTRPFWRALANVLKVLLQLILIVIFMGALGAGLYFAIPWLYRATIVPVQNNTADITDLSRRVAQAEAQVDQRTEALQARNADLEGELAELHETVAVQDRILATAAAELATLVPGMDGLHITTDSQTEELIKLEQTLARALRELGDQSKLLDAQATVLDEQADEFADLQTEFTAQTEALAEQSEDLAALKADITGRMALLQTADVRLQVDGTATKGKKAGLTPEKLSDVSGNALDHLLTRNLCLRNHVRQACRNHDLLGEPGHLQSDHKILSGWAEGHLLLKQGKAGQLHRHPVVSRRKVFESESSRPVGCPRQAQACADRFD